MMSWPRGLDQGSLFHVHLIAVSSDAAGFHLQ